MTIGDMIRARARELAQTDEAVARQFDVSSSTVTRWRTGATTPQVADGSPVYSSRSSLNQSPDGRGTLLKTSGHVLDPLRRDVHAPRLRANSPRPEEDRGGGCCGSRRPHPPWTAWAASDGGVRRQPSGVLTRLAVPLSPTYFDTSDDTADRISATAAVPPASRHRAVRTPRSAAISATVSPSMRRVARRTTLISGRCTSGGRASSPSPPSGQQPAAGTCLSGLRTPTAIWLAAWAMPTKRSSVSTRCS